VHERSSRAHLADVEHSHLPVDLGVPQAAGSADAQPELPAEKPSDPFPHMPVDGILGPTREAEIEVLGPSRHKSVQPGAPRAGSAPIAG
jgi:hypothetical protein